MTEDTTTNAPTIATASFNKELLQCRMYENKYPEVDDLVMVRVRQIAEMGAYVHLLEYNNTEGMVLLSELSRSRIRSIQKLIRVGRDEVVVVLRVDKEKGYIDLSKRRVSPEDVQRCKEKFRKSCEVHSILHHVAEKRQMSLELLYQTVGWPLYRKFGHAYDAFKMALSEPEKVFEEISIITTPEDSASTAGVVGITEEVKRTLMSVIRKRLTPHATKIRADIDVTCFGYEGIEAIKQALAEGESCSVEGAEVKIKLVAPPNFVMITNCMVKQLGVDTLERAIVKIDEKIRASGGQLVVKMKPRTVNETDDQELDALMERFERENTQVAGDEDDEEDQQSDNEEEVESDG